MTVASSCRPTFVRGGKRLTETSNCTLLSRNQDNFQKSSGDDFCEVFLIVLDGAQGGDSLGGGGPARATTLTSESERQSAADSVCGL